MAKINDLTGRRFGRLVVLNREKSKNGKTCWLCQCDCGNKKIIKTTHLISKNTISCGCYRTEKHKKSITLFKKKHGLSKDRIYKILNGIKQRCLNKNSKIYKNYGGRGITICDEWKNDFMAFYKWSMENGYKDDLTIDRIDNNGNYEPSNCRWVTAKEQANNTRHNHFIEFNGEKYTISQWADFLKINRNIIDKRIQAGKTNVEDIFNGLI